MKNLVKNVINVINKNKLFVILVLVLAGVVSILLKEFGAALAFLLFATGIRFFVAVWHAPDTECDVIRAGFKTLFAGSIIFMSAGILNLVKECLLFRGCPTFGLEYVVQPVAYIGMGCMGLFFVGCILFLLVSAWNVLVRWAR